MQNDNLHALCVRCLLDGHVIAIRATHLLHRSANWLPTARAGREPGSSSAAQIRASNAQGFALAAISGRDEHDKAIGDFNLCRSNLRGRSKECYDACGGVSADDGIGGRSRCSERQPREVRRVVDVGARDRRWSGSSTRG